MTDFEFWCSLDEATSAELKAITDEKEIEDRFYKNLEFGTGGMRGIMGAGPNRMNKYTIAKATTGLADYLLAKGKKDLSVAIAFDSRNNSSEFAKISALILADKGIKAYLFDKLMPTPVLSFAVRYLECDAGIVVTASHNPKEYNGYKVYDNKGCQLVPKDANELIKFVDAVKLSPLPDFDFDAFVSGGKIEMVGDKVLEAFLAECKKISLFNDKSGLKIVYTPLHGTGNIPVRTILKDYDLTIVSEQELPDGNFSTVRSPNPEERDALTIAIEKAKAIDADIVIGTDPDCDRVGIAVKHNDEFILFTGNQTGALLMDFILRFRKDRGENPAVVKTIVTSSLGSAIAEKYGCTTVETLTGFKYIGEKICQWEDDGKYNYLFGYEESYGYLAGTHARDKDAVSSSMLIAEMAAWHKSNGRTLVDALAGLYNEYGYCYDCLENIVMKGKEGAEMIRAKMDSIRNKGENLFDGAVMTDYVKGIGDLPKENVLRFDFSDGSWTAVRPSGTEPKIKMYYSIKGENEVVAKERQKKISDIVDNA